MGDSRISNALKALSGGLQTIANYRGAKEEREETRNFQKGMQESQQAFQARMQEMSQGHQEQMLTKTQEFQGAEGDKDRLFRKEMFAAEQGAANARHAQSMAATWAGIKQSAATQAAAIEDRNLQRQLKVYELGVTQAAGQYEKINEQMGKEVQEILKNEMLNMPGKEKDRNAAIQSIQQRYAPELKEAGVKIEQNMASYAELVGIKPEEVKPAAGSAPAGGAGLDRDKVGSAVQAAKAQLGDGAMPSESALVSGFMGQGLSRPEAISAARQLRSGVMIR